MYEVVSKENIEIEYTSSFLNKWFKDFNKKYFNNKLKVIPTNWGNKKGSYFTYSINMQQRKIAPVKISIRKTISTFEDLRNNLVHEMLHYYVDCHLINPDKYNWIEYVRIYKNSGRSKAINYLLGEPHGSMWQEQARTLNSTYKELDICSFADDTSKNLSKLKKDAKKLHLICEIIYENKKSSGKSRYYFVSQQRYNKIINSLKNKKQKDSYSVFYEHSIDTRKLVSSLKETPDGYHLKTSSLKYYENLKVINLNEFAKLLGYKDN